MKHLIDETIRRRSIQIEFNKKYNITPKTVTKANNIMDSMMTKKSNKEKQDLNLKSFENKLDSLDKIEALDYVEKLKRKMKKYAQNFQFEDAAMLRDQIIKINGKINE